MYILKVVLIDEPASFVPEPDTFNKLVDVDNGTAAVDSLISTFTFLLLVFRLFFFFLIFVINIFELTFSFFKMSSLWWNR